MYVYKAEESTQILDQYKLYQLVAQFASVQVAPPDDQILNQCK